MLIDEAKIAVQLGHPNIVPVHELAREDGAYYIAMEYVPGVDLRKLCQKALSQKKKIPVDVSLHVLCEVLEGLSYAHSKKNANGQALGIVHRDVSPQNILLSYDGTVKLTDFGIAKAASRSHETIAGVLKGKFAYMSPEQANQQDLDERSDVYSAAIVFYELLTGERLFYRGSDIDTLDRVRRGQVTFSADAEKILPLPLKQILTKALSKERQERYQKASDLRDDLLKFAHRKKKRLHREKLAGFIEDLFASEMEEEKEEKTRLMTEVKTLLLQEGESTRTVVAKEVLAQGPRPETVLLEPTQTAFVPTHRVSRIPFRVPPEYWIGSGVLLMAAAVIFWIYKNEPVPLKAVSAQAPHVAQIAPPETGRAVPEEVAPPISETQAVSAHVELPAPNKTPVPLVSPTLTKTKTEPPAPGGYLSVQAIPWGYVSINGAGRRETPVRRIQLKAGRHRVTVRYEPNNTTVSGVVNIASDRESVCIADFRGAKELRCEK